MSRIITRPRFGSACPSLTRRILLSLHQQQKQEEKTLLLARLTDLGDSQFDTTAAEIVPKPMSTCIPVDGCVVRRGREQMISERKSFFLRYNNDTFMHPVKPFYPMCSRPDSQKTRTAPSRSCVVLKLPTQRNAWKVITSGSSFARGAPMSSEMIVFRERGSSVCCLCKGNRH